MYNTAVHPSRGIILLPLLLLILSLSSNAVHGFIVDEYSTRITIDSSGNSRVALSLTLDSTGVGDYLSLPAMDPVDLDVYDSGGTLKFAVINDSVLVRPDEHRAGYIINMEYTTSTLTVKNGALWGISYVFRPYEHLQYDNIKRMYMRVDLPRRSKLRTFTPGALVAAEGGYISVQWAMEDMKIDSSFAFKIEYLTPAASLNSPGEGMIYGLPLKNKDNALFLFIILTILSVALYGYKRFPSWRRKKEGEDGEGRLEVKEDVLKSVSQTQRRILLILAEHGGILYQSRLQRMSGISKATLSRNLDQLRIKDIIVKVAVGNVNEIRLQEWVLKRDS